MDNFDTISIKIQTNTPRNRERLEELIRDGWRIKNVQRPSGQTTVEFELFKEREK
jgi:hypothetical protein